MTFEAGTADILTTCDPPFPPEEEVEVLRAIFRRAGDHRYASGVRLTNYGTSSNWFLDLTQVQITAREKAVLEQLWRRR